MPHRWSSFVVGLVLVFAARPVLAVGSDAAGQAAVVPSFSAPAMHLVLILLLLFVVILMRMGRRRDP